MFLHKHKHPNFISKNGTTGTNSIPLGGSVWASQRNQWLYSPDDFGSKVPGGKAISTIYLKTGSIADAAATYTDFRISLGQPSTTGLSSTFITGLSQVLSANSYTMASSSANSWIKIELDKPFNYDPKKPLVVETIQTATSGRKTLASGGTPLNSKLYRKHSNLWWSNSNFWFI